MRSRTILVLTFGVLIVLAGCSGAQVGGGGGASEADQARATAAPSGEAGGEREQVATGSGQTNIRTDRVRIRTGRVRLEVQAYDRTRTNLTSLARSHGGYVSGSNEDLHREGNATWTTGRVVLRVPKENFSKVYAQVKAEGKVLHSETQTKDVTDQLVDINARLKNLRAQRERLRTLYEQANDTEAILKINKRLSEVQTEIERLEAQKRSLKQRVAYATITVELREPRPEEEEVDRKQWYDTGVIAAFLSSVEGVIVALRALVVLGAYIAPYAIVFGSPFVVLGAFLWHRYG